jgi:hypothetical protein
VTEEQGLIVVVENHLLDIQRSAVNTSPGGEKPLTRLI